MGEEFRAFFHAGPGRTLILACAIGVLLGVVIVWWATWMADRERHKLETFCSSLDAEYRSVPGGWACVRDEEVVFKP